MAKIDFKRIEKKWQSRWEKGKVFEAEANSKKKKFYVAIVYPYMNGLLHIGHLYTYTLSEIMLRYKRMKGFNVLAKFGFHCTGAPIVAAAQRIKEKEKQQIEILKQMGIKEKDINKFSNPEYWCEYFPKETLKDIKKFGFSIDKRYVFKTTSLNPPYDKFIKWQFNKLKEKGYVVKGKHPVVWDPKTNMPTGDHDRIKGEGVVPQEFTLLKFKLNDTYMVAATLRPETIYGQTNLWVNPDVIYKKANVDNEIWIASEECFNKLKDQDKKIELIEDVKGKEFLGKFAAAPGINKEIIILPANFVDPKIGTGIVTSVPSDAPYDYVALKELQDLKEIIKKEKYGFNIEQIKAIEDIEVTPIIKTEKYGDKAAVKVVEDENITSQNDEKLESLTQEVYKEGFHNGIMLATCGQYKGMKIIEAKNKIKKNLLKNGKADIMYELTEEVISRSLAKCIVKVVSDQWFIKYGDKRWKKQVHKALKKIKLYPETVREQFNYVVDWLNDWACTREYGLGTRLPWDEKWIIESLSDSTIQMAYNTISKYLQNPKQYKIKIDKLNDEFFDYVFLDKGNINEIGKTTKIPKKIIKKMKSDFEYWYPFDFRNSGKELVQNHLTFCIFNHSAIFPEKYLPKSLGINGMIMVNKEKMSKSKGNFFTAREMYEKYGSDVVRLTEANAGEGIDDANYDMEFLENSKTKLIELYAFSKKNYNKGRTNITNSDKWFEHIINKLVKETTENMENFKFKSALQYGFFDMRRYLKKYMKITGNNPNKRIINFFIETQAKLIAPFTPHIAEEIWKIINKKTYISLEKWPIFDNKKINKNYEEQEKIQEKIIEDIRNLLKLVKFHPKNVYLYTIPNEKKLLLEAKDFFEREFNLKFDVFATNEKNKYDPQNKSSRSKKHKPAIYLE